MEHLNKSKEFRNVAIGTLALGDQYVMHAILLANDLLLYHPDNKFYVLTDKPEVFSSLKNVIAFPHKTYGVKRCYHDKRFVIEKMMASFEKCVFLDADSRLLGEIDFRELLVDGIFITCLNSKNLYQKLNLSIEKREKKAVRRLKILQCLANKLNVSFAKISFLHEPLLVFQRDYGDIERFLAAWNFCAIYTALRFFEFSEGSSIGISAEMTGAKTRSLGKNPHWLFKDQLEDYTHKNAFEIERSRQLINVRLAIEVSYKRKSLSALMIPIYIFRYCKNIFLYIGEKSFLKKINL